jgi:hypothetical protein
MTNIGHIALELIVARDQLKFYHWSTKVYARHSASDKFVSSLTDKIDRFIEVMQGTENKRIVIPNTKITFENHTDVTIVKYLKTFREWLTDELPKHINETSTDLINIRDEILADVNNTLYLFTFS